MKNKMDELLKAALTPMDAPSERLNYRILGKIKERESMKRRKRIPAAAVIAACTLVFGSVTAFAAHRYLSPAEAATELEDDALKKAFLSEDAVLVNEVQESGGYRITLLGSVAGKNLSDYMAWDDAGLPKDDRLYAVVAIEHADGTPMPDTSSTDYGKEPFYTSCYVRGLNPLEFSINHIGGGYSAFVKDGVEYRVMEMDNIEIFADRGIYVGVNSGIFYDAEAYIYEESTGKLSRNPDYQGVNALFQLPMDESKANPEAAARYLEDLENAQNAPSEPIEMDENDLEIEAFIEKLTEENIDQYASPIESTRQSCMPDKEGWISYEYELEDGSGGNGDLNVEELLSSGKAGDIQIAGYGYTENGMEDLMIDVCILNEDGTVTYVVYQPIME